jgi:hypothetical protein
MYMIQDKVKPSIKQDKTGSEEEVKCCIECLIEKKSIFQQCQLLF